MSGPARRPLPPAWAGLIEAYLIAETGAGRSRATLATRRGHLAHLARELRCAPAAVTTEKLLGWFGRQAWSADTRRSYRGTCVSFFRWVHRAGHLPADPAADLPIVRGSAPSPRPVPDDVWMAAIAAADPRVRLMLRLAAEAGLRRAEVAQLHIRDLTRGPFGYEILVHGKGAKLRTLPISDDLAAAIAKSVQSTDTPDGYLFPGDDDGHLSPRWVGRLCRDAMPDGWTMHKLRHRFASRAFRGSRNLPAVQHLLGHSSIATTQRYVAVSDDEIRAAAYSALFR